MPDDLATLEARVSAGFTWLYEREERARSLAVNIRHDPKYAECLDVWEGLLDDYQHRLTHLKITKA